jgi:hypothetical protein
LLHTREADVHGRRNLLRALPLVVKLKDTLLPFDVLGPSRLVGVLVGFFGGPDVAVMLCVEPEARDEGCLLLGVKLSALKDLHLSHGRPITRGG